MLNNTAGESTTYLQLEGITDHQGCVTLLMTPNRWLSVDEMHFIFKAHGKSSVAITSNVYPIYDPQCLYYIIHNNHYEPVTQAV